MKKKELEVSLTKVIKAKKTFFQFGIMSWGKKNYRYFAWRENRTPYSVLVSEILLKRTTASAVKRIYEEFMSEYPDVQALAKADREKLEKLLLRIGYHKRRTDIFLKISDYILKVNKGQIPKSKGELLAIPFVGHYTAGAVMSLGYGVPSVMVDSNVGRITRRLFFKHLSEKTPVWVIQKIAEILYRRDIEHQRFNYALLDFGAAICRYGTPRCSACLVSKLCDYHEVGKPSK